MKKALLAAALAAVSVCAYAQTPAPEPAKAPAATGETKQSPAARIKVEKMVTAAAVENKEPVNETSVFDAATGRVYAWTRVTASEAPVKIKHIYYVNDKKLTEVELNINARAYRAWSSKSVWPGNWKVEAVDEAGEVLAAVIFTVSGAAQALAPKEETPTQGK